MQFVKRLPVNGRKRILFRRIRRRQADPAYNLRRGIFPGKHEESFGKAGLKVFQVVVYRGKVLIGFAQDGDQTVMFRFPLRQISQQSIRGLMVLFAGEDFSKQIDSWISGNSGGGIGYEALRPFLNGG